MGIVTVFEWDMFFPDLLDLWVLKTLPIAEARAFLARVAAIAIFVAGFLFDINIFATLVLPAAIDPPNLPRFLAAHLLATFGAGLFAAAFILALQGVLLSVLGERLFRKISLVLQSLSITALLLLLFLFPVFSGVVPALLKSGSAMRSSVRPSGFSASINSSWKAPPRCPSTPRSQRSAAPHCFSSPRSPSSPIRLPICAACANWSKAPASAPAATRFSRPLNRPLPRHRRPPARPPRRLSLHQPDRAARPALPHLSRPLWRRRPLRRRHCHPALHVVHESGAHRPSPPTAFVPRSASSPSGSSPECAWPSSPPAISREAGSFASCMAGRRSFIPAMQQLQAAKTWVLLWAVAVTLAACVALRAHLAVRAAHLARNHRPGPRRRRHLSSAHRHLLSQSHHRSLHRRANARSAQPGLHRAQVLHILSRARRASHRHRIRGSRTALLT